MTKRVDLRAGDATWTAAVETGRVTLGADRAFTVRRLESGDLEIAGPDGRARGAAIRHGDHVWVTIEGEVFEFVTGAAARRSRATAHDADALSAPMPATVVRIGVEIGATVNAGDVLIALEAMKMEMPIRAPHDGTITAIHCREGELVQPGTALVSVEERDRLQAPGLRP